MQPHTFVSGRPISASHDYGFVDGVHVQVFVEAIPETELYRAFLYEGPYLTFTFTGEDPRLMADTAQSAQREHSLSLSRRMRLVAA
jgi:hypothetical protein